MLRILALAGFFMSGLVGFWQIAAGSISPFTPFFLIAMSLAFIFLFSGINRVETNLEIISRQGGSMSALNIVFADLLRQALDLKITEKDLQVEVVSTTKNIEGGTLTDNRVLIKPLTEAGMQAFDEIRAKRAEALGENGKGRLAGVYFGTKKD